ncbi:MAG: UbiA prenyltransferase family protein [Planctomycetes bacterium]|nr:UbiA prenyltransferase family protein [Planctomycetota bacterium]
MTSEDPEVSRSLSSTTDRRASSRGADLIRLARPHHWIKNGFILIPLPFAVAAGAQLNGGTIALGFVGFSLLASASYVFNDVRDAERDRQHPRKRNRPVAAGRIGDRWALIFSVLLASLGIGLLGLTALGAAIGLGLVYLGINLVYSSFGKHIGVVDVTLLAIGFLVRVVFGCALVRVAPSGWLVGCTSTMALFLALTKRRADLVAGLDVEHRPSLAHYSIRGIDIALAAVSMVAIVTYVLYCFDSPVFREGRELASAPFVLLGFLNDFRLIRKSPEMTPVERVYRQPTHFLILCGWAASVGWSLIR